MRFNHNEEGEIIFQIPKFSFGSNLYLDDTLRAMGITSAFRGDAAFTKIDYNRSVPPNGKVAKMILERPFIFAIRSNDGTILFVGVVNSPKEGKE